ncbi:MAG: NAD(P)H-hydrate epimerase [Planctomycetaceae bacterium]|nr:NAD(P)H-hydrate epimerase [Planctomycetaceae bacterium]
MRTDPARATTETYNAVLTREQVRDVDRCAIEEYGVPGIVLMENAGRGAAECLLRQRVTGPVVICCGRGNNGGDGFVIARHLDLAGAQVHLVLTSPVAELSGDARINADIAARSELPMTVLPEQPDAAVNEAALHGAEWIVDALLGTGTRGEVREPFASVIEAINRSGAKVLAVDLPSGLDCDTGQPLGPCVRAELTATFVARKVGFDNPDAAGFLGSVNVIGIGAPRRLLDDVLNRSRNGSC